MSADPDDETVQAFIHAHPNGAAFHEIAELLGVSHQAVQQICSRATEKCLRALRWKRIYAASDVCPDRSGDSGSSWDAIY